MIPMPSYSVTSHVNFYVSSYKSLAVFICEDMDVVKSFHQKIYATITHAPQHNYT